MAIRLSSIAALAPVLANTRNSKGRPIPIHMRSSPGIGKTATAAQAARNLAAAMPGHPVGFAVANLSVMNPSDIAGILLFDSVQDPESGRIVKRAVFTTPPVFRVSTVFYAPPGDDSTPVALPMPAEPLFAGDVIRVPGARPMRVDHGILLLDEFQQSDPDIQAAAAPLFDEGRAGSHYLPRGWQVWAASNRASDRSNVKRALAFITNRVATLDIAPPPPGELAAYFGGPPVAPQPPLVPLYAPPTDGDRPAAHPALLAWAKANHDAFFAGVPDDPSQPFLTPRSFESVSSLFDSMLRAESGAILTEESSHCPDDYELRREVFSRLSEGLVGQETVASLMAFVDAYTLLPRPHEVWADPESAKVPEREDMRMAIGLELAQSMGRQHIAAFMTYVMRLGHAVSLMAVATAIRRGAVPVSHPAAQAFLRNNREIAPQLIAAATKVATRRAENV